MDQISYKDENEKIRAQRQKIADARPVYGSNKHYESSEERAIYLNKKIRECYAIKKLYQIDIEYYLAMKDDIKSEAHFRGMIVELLVMNYLLREDAARGFLNMPQFSTSIFDNDKDIIVGGRNVECKGETPVFIGNGISFPENQKRKVLSSDDLFIAVYGSKDGQENWACGYIWHFEPKTMPETEWLDYPAGPIGNARPRFGHDMGTSLETHTQYGKPVEKIPAKIYSALVDASGSQFETEEKFKKTKKDYSGFFPIPWADFVRRQRNRHNW